MSRRSYKSAILNDDPIVRDHTVHEARVLPGVAILDLIYRILIAEGRAIESIEIRDLLFLEPFVTSERFDQEILVEIEEKTDREFSVRVQGRRTRSGELMDAEWRDKARCLIAIDDPNQPTPAFPIPWAWDSLTKSGAGQDADALYEAVRRVRIQHREFLKPTGSVWTGPDATTARLELTPAARGHREDFALHPAFLDAATLAPFLRPSGAILDGSPRIPIHIQSFRAWGRTSDVCRIVALVPNDEATAAGSDVLRRDLAIFDDSGRGLAVFRGCVTKKIRSPEQIQALVRDAAPKAVAVSDARPIPSDEENRDRIADAVRGAVAAAMGRRADQIDPNLGFYDQGLDSTRLLEIVKALESRFQRELYPTLLFEHPTVDELSRHLIATFGERALASVLDGETPPPSPAADSLPEPLQATGVGAALDQPREPIIRYRVEWAPAPRIMAAATSESGAGLIALIRDRQDEEWIQAIAAGSRRAIVEPGARFRVLGGDRYQIHPARERDYEQLASALNDSDIARDGWNVIHAWNRHAEPLPPRSDVADQAFAELTTGAFSLHALVRAWISVNPRKKGKLFILCGDSGRPHDSAIAGYARTLRREHPGLMARALRLDPSVSPDDLAAIMRSELADDRSPWPAEIAYRSGQRLMRALIPCQNPSAHRIEFQPGGVYLISGGSGGMGLAIAERIARVHRGQVALLGRRPLTAKLNTQLQAMGAVHHYRADVEQAEEVAAAVAKIENELGPIRGIIHAAGVLDDGLIRGKTPTSFERVAAPKLLGALNLDWATRSSPLDFFVSFSSISALLGNPGQADYAYANAFLGQFAEHREMLRARGERRGSSIAVAWPLIQGAGMGVSPEQKARIRAAYGLSALTLDEAVDLLPQLLSAEAAQIAVVRGSPRELEGAGVADQAPASTVEPRPRAETSRTRSPAPIAIIGVSGRYPEATDLEEFWRNLRSGRDCIREIPRSRWDHRDHYDPSRSQANASFSKWGGFLDGHDQFDPLFFKMSPREARQIDPQERLFLETAYAATEDAGYPGRMLSERHAGQVGVFVGAMWSEYQLFADRAADGLRPASWFSSIANRVSYAFDFQGPSLPVDTACSSSLAAVHLACEAIRRGECAVAIAGGVNLSLHPNKYVKLSQMQMLSSDGRCRAFGAGGDGYVPGEGVGAVVLKRLDAAIADGDVIHGVILASALNHGGRTSGYTVPNPSAQARLIRAALDRGGIDPATITYIEAHGAGTGLGDPIEIAGLTRAFNTGNSVSAQGTTPCALGAVKSNIGHLESAAGIAALTKVLLQFRHRALVPTLHSDPPNPALDLEAGPFRLQREFSPWTPPAEVPRRAGVSSFGAGGVNVHLILEEPPALSPGVASPGPEAIVVSARTEEALRASARRLSGFLSAEPERLNLADVACTLRTGREPMEWRLAFTAASLKDAARILLAFADADHGQFPDDLRYGRAPDVAEMINALVASTPVRGRRISLPTYPFAQERYWVDDGEARTLRHVVVKQTVRADDPAIRDHLVRGRAVLAASFLMRMAMDADDEGSEKRWTTIRNLRLSEPILVRESTAITLTVDQVSRTFEVQAGPAGDAESAIITARGSLEQNRSEWPNPAKIAIDAILDVCPRRLDRSELDRRFAARGIGYGPRHQLLETLHTGNGQALGSLLASADSDAVGILDAALQTCVGFLVDDRFASTRLILPVGVGEAIVDREAIASARWVWATRASDCNSVADEIRLKLTLADRNGRVVAVLNDATFQAAWDAATDSQSGSHALGFYRPVWRLETSTTTASGAESTRSTALIVGHGRLCDELATLNAGRTTTRLRLNSLNRQEDFDQAIAEMGALDEIDFVLTIPNTIEEGKRRGALALLRLTKALARAGKITPGMRWRVIDATGGRDPSAAAAIGLARVIRREYQDIALTAIEIKLDEADSAAIATAAQAILRERPAPSVREIAIRDGARWIKRWERITPPPLAHVKLPLRPGGVYVIVGGARGIGFAVALALAERTGGRIVLLGRRPIDDEIRVHLRQLEDHASAALYLTGDASRFDDLSRMLDEVRSRFGAIHGVAHSAVVLRDSALETMSETDFQSAMAVKAEGIAALDRATERDSLDFLALFSSAGSLLGNAGQGNYLAGSAFLDAYGARLAAERPQTTVRVINWGYWGETGVVASPAHRDRLARRGIFPIGVAEGVEAFFRCLGSPWTQIIAIKSDESELRDWLDDDYARAIEADARLDRWCADALLGVLHRLAGSPPPGVAISRERFHAEAGVSPKHERLVLALWSILRDAGYVENDPINGWRFTQVSARVLSNLNARLERQRRDLIANAPEFADRCRLAAISLEALPDVLAGRRPATEVLFPDGSLELVACAYSGHAVVDRFNSMASSLILDQFRNRDRQASGPFRVLEVGAGTGSTSAYVIPALFDRSDYVPGELEYHFTDVSPAFFRAARRRFGDHPEWVVRTRSLDIGRPIATQDFESGTFDIVLGAHVLHATADLEESLRNARRLLKPGGLLVLNEPTKVRPFLTCVFGLTDGWWLHRDDSRRLQGSPLLDPAEWSAVLARCGFEKPRAQGLSDEAPPDRCGQALLIAANPIDDAAIVAATPQAPRSAAARPTHRIATADPFESKLRELIGAALDLSPDRIEADRSLAEYGLDSITGVDLARRINREFSVSLRTTALFDYSSVRRLAEFLRQSLPSPLPPTTAPKPEPEPARPPTRPRSSGWRALRLTGPSALDRLEAAEFELGPPGPQEIQIAPLASAINFGDLLCVKGLYPTMPDYPFTPGFETAGIVTAVGAKIDPREFKIGDEVAAILGDAMGGHAERVNVNARFAVLKPSNVSFVEAAAFPVVFLTARYALRKAELSAGESVLIHSAAGGTGLTALRMAQALGAKIYATVGSTAKIDYLRSQGVEHVLNYREHDFAVWIQSLTDGRGVDAVINMLSGDAIQKGLDALAPGGRYVEIAMTGLLSGARVDLSRLVRNQSFASLDLRRLLLSSPETTKQAMRMVREALENREFLAHIDQVVPFDQAASAYRLLEERRNIGKVVLAFNNPAVQPILEPAVALSSDSATAPTIEDDRIAVIGMSGRFPGARNIEEFWANLLAGRDAIMEPPPGRWDQAAESQGANPWKAGFLSRDEVEGFDAAFFQITGAEAEWMDPQQRLFLEEAWKAFEQAGYSDQRLARTKCGVYVGANGGDHWRRLEALGVKPDSQTLVGNHASILAARIAYRLDLKGPSVAIDTACSSSLVALHMACHALKAGDCEMALAGGAFVMSTPTFHELCGKAGMLSPGGRCRSFADGADGFAPGEAVAVVVLKKLTLALADGDPILATIRGTTINQDGRSNGITAPSGLSQTQLIQGLHERLGLDPATIGCIEAHGTGTALGDPIEVEALTAAFRARTDKTGFCALGSVKSHIGHTVYAAGVAGVIKAILAIRNGVVPPSLHFDQPNPHLRLEETPFLVNSRPRPWPRPDGHPRRAGVSSFGFSGTNAHAILEEAPAAQAHSVARRATDGPRLIAISAKTESALAQRLADLRAWLDSSAEDARAATLSDIARTLGEGRSHFDQRFAVVATDRDDLRRALADPNAARARRSSREDLQALADAYQAGATIDWTDAFAQDDGRRIPMPSYPFDRRPCGLPTPQTPVPRSSRTHADDRDARIRERLRTLIAGSLRIDSAALKPDTTWESLGIDSLAVAKLNQAFETEFGALPKTLFFEHRSLAALERFFADRANVVEPSLDAAPVPSRTTPPTASPSRQDIAIIGAAGRYPMAADLDEFWANLAAGRDCVGPIPPDRWDVNRHYSSDRSNPTTSYCRFGGFIDGHDEFDPLFFGISPREAELMDPQERLFLQTAWHALEDAGYTRSQLADGRSESGLGGRVGVFAGVTWGGYQLFAAEEWAAGRVAISGGSFWTIANRVSHVMNFNGPSLPVDTACSSSLTAIHLAYEAIKRGECDAALAGGVNLYVHPLKYVGMSQQEFLASDGKCRSFGRGGDGFVPGEGVGVVLLKPLAQAIADGDSIHAVIKATAVNHGGKTNGYTIPNPQAQAELIAQAIAASGVDPQTISCVEAHGTGTALGDPIEVAALSRAFGSEAVAAREFRALGSVKSNIGHLESAAGIAGLTKLLLQFRHRKLAPTLHADEPNPNLDLPGASFQLSRELTDWTSERGPRRAAISSFGAGGSNAHAILEEAPRLARSESADAIPSPPELVPLSARTPDRLADVVRRLRDWLAADPSASAKLGDIAFTLRSGREAMACRTAFVVSSRSELAHELDDWLRDGPKPLSPYDADATLTRLANRWLSGEMIDWSVVLERGGRRRISLPGYPFAQERYWLPRGEPMTPPALPSPRPPDPEAAALASFREIWREAPLAPADVEPDSDHSSWALAPDDAGAFRWDREVWAPRIHEAVSVRRLRIHCGWGLTDDPIAACDRLLTTLLALIQDVTRSLPGVRVEIVYGCWDDSPVHAVVKGMLRTWVREAAEASAKLVHISTDDAKPSWPQVLEALRTEPWAPVGHCAEIHRNGSARRERLWELADDSVAPANFADFASTPALPQAGVYVITGATGKLGTSFARELARTRQARLILLGRSRFDAARVREIRALTELGGEAIYLQTDVADLRQLTDALERGRRRFGPINAVIHAAGTIEDAALARKDPQSMRRVLAPKIAGAIHLDQATRDDPLRLFLLFSSLAGSIGNSGQADYAAANAFLDAFAAWRSAASQRGERSGRSLAIAWPLWRDGGMSISQDRLPEIERTVGMIPMPDAAGFQALSAALTAPDEIAALTVVYGRLGKLRELFTAPWSSTPTAVIQPAAPARQRAENPERGELIALLQSLFGREFKLEPDRIDPDVALDNYGVNSVAIRKVCAALSARFGPVPETAFFEHPRISSLADHLLERLGDRVRTQLPRAIETTTASATIAPVPAQVSADDIAVIGVAGRYPGAADMSRFWENLRAGVDGVTTVPESRWDMERLYDPVRGRPGKSYCKWGGFLDDVDRFDALFFNIAPRDAELMDPQERLFLQIAWQTVEDAGYTRESLRSSVNGEVGVFVGATWGSYQLFGAEAWARGQAIYPNSCFWSIANRVSYVFDWRGPSVAVDTACSSSLTAIHWACEAIKRGECVLALAGGVNLYLHPSKYAQMASMGFSATDGKCRSFGAGGDGYAPGEGVGAVLLKPLAQAIRDRDAIWGVIKSSVSNHGGRANGYTVPNPAAQADLVVKALRQARINPRTIGYLEAHGTGTELGDPIEIEGLTRAFRQVASGPIESPFCALGSVKSNIGHLESAAGIAGVAKVLLQFRHRRLAPTLHVETVNPKLDLEATPFRLQRDSAHWRRLAETPRRAGVSSFGAGGANAHVILEEFEPSPAEIEANSNPVTAIPALVVLSARSPDRLRAIISNLKEALEAEEPPLLRDLAWTLQVGREAMSHRLAWIVASIDELKTRLNDALSSTLDAVTPTDRAFAGVVDSAGASARSPVRDPRALSLEETARAWTAGAEFDWAKLHEGDVRPPYRVSLPPYPFVGKRHWIAIPEAQTQPTLVPASAPLISRIVPAVGPALFESRLEPSQPWISDHRVDGRLLAAGTVVLEIVREAADLLAESGPWEIAGYTWIKPIFIEDDGTRIQTLIAQEDGDDELSVRVAIGSELAGVGRLRRASRDFGCDSADAGSGPKRFDIESKRAKARDRISPDEFYETFPALGIEYGPFYQCVRTIWTSPGLALAQLGPAVSGSAAESQTGFTWHPGLLDSALQLAQLLLTEASGGAREPCLPASIGRATIFDRAGIPVYGVTRIRPIDRNVETERRAGRFVARFAFDVSLADSQGWELARIEDFRVRTPVRSVVAGQPTLEDLIKRQEESGLGSRLAKDQDQLMFDALRRLAAGELSVSEAELLMSRGSNGGGR